VAVLGDRERPADIVAAFQSGANVYFDSRERWDAFIKALELVMLGETILPLELLFYVRCPEGEETSTKIGLHQPEPAAKRSQLAEREWPQLSVRENGILRCIVEGASNKVIARTIDITEATVKVHVKAILRKVRVRNRTQAAIWAMNHAGEIWHDGYSPTKGAVALLIPPPSSPFQTLSDRKIERWREKCNRCASEPFYEPAMTAFRSRTSAVILWRPDARSLGRPISFPGRLC
jgi:DNA-binding NarL/FixJ family response regulator